MSTRYDAQEISRIFSQYQGLMAAIAADPQFGFDLDWKTFCEVVSMLSIKARGARLEKRIILKNGFCKIHANKNLGDFRTKDGHCVELKCTILTVANKLGTFRGIRPWQKLNAHLFVVIDLRDLASPQTATFWINESDMPVELELLKARPVSGTKLALKENKNIELGFNLNVDPQDPHYARWCQRYLVKEILL